MVIGSREGNVSTYEDLLSQFSRLTEKSARFRRVVLHVHSPDSYDFGDRKACDPALNERSQYRSEQGKRDYINHFVGRFDIVAVTDHMRAGYACELARIASQRPDLCVLPGIELNVRLDPPVDVRLHLVVIFPESKTVGEVERIFTGGIPDDKRRTGKEEISIDDLRAFLQTLRERHNGFCIAAHVDNDNGVRKLFRQTGRETLGWFSDTDEITREQEQEISESFKQYLVKAKFDGIEVRSPGDRQHYSWVTEPSPGVKHQVPVFLTFDAHSIEELSSTDRVNYIKMADISWQGLVDAAKFPDTRIRFTDECVPPPYVAGVEIISPSEKGFFRELQLGFVENLNCIIGPRGSGKSTIVEALRYIFGYNRTLDQLESKDLVTAAKQRQKRNLVDSIIRVAYRVSDSEVHFLEATYDPQSDYATKVYDIDGNSLLVNDVERDGRYPLRLFGWSEIETLGREPARQRDLLDKFIKELPEKHDRERAIRNELVSNSRRIRTELENLAECLQGEGSEIRCYREYQQEFDNLNTPEVQNLFAALDQERRHLDFLQKLQFELTSLETRIASILPTVPTESTEASTNWDSCLSAILTEPMRTKLSSDPELSKWWHEVSSDQLGLDSSYSALVAHLRQVREDANYLSRKVIDLVEQLQRSIGSIEGQIRQQVSADPGTQVLADLRDEAKKRLERVERLRERYNRVFAGIGELLDGRKQLVGELLQCREHISDLRAAKKSQIEEQLNEFQTSDMRISLEFTRDGDRGDFLEHLSGFTQLGEVYRYWRSKKWPALIARACTPCQFAEYVLNTQARPLCVSATIEGESCSIDHEDAVKIVKHLNPYGADEDAGIDTIDPDKLRAILNVQEVAWNDQERILRNGQPVDSASPGQRSSAMLPLIALAESVPLLIDQPEDNLDNRLVGKVLVDILAKLKEKRQIIVATHNPNIVVLGDSEHVIVLDAVSDIEGMVELPQASVDHSVIVERIIDLLEGGKEAFETRRKRYLEA